ncbi:hypothetical protein CF66_2142 [Candidatus Photodesmus katoptron]|uniref:PilZ domain-containing protein n=1 Tax=Candidatus Photodesmus katoptron Akat1 TaxID=1236703 RepID=S3DJF1_9GAMM|nr:hypothetical protein [Candidatus Photodesmus katoptron]EPE37810.1 hypothetical protein O1U_0272 [Candidatus Photodesmus katoptron Akat1]KEY90471.1 hypothetical protein CF66_2142 [Candidatus Photodesmus katoptron]
MLEQDFFTVNHKMTANVEPMDNQFSLPSQEQFELEIPAPFIIANKFSKLDRFNDNALLELKNNKLNHVIQLLDNQNSKLNLLLSFALSQHNNMKYSQSTLSFGASKFSYGSSNKLSINTIVRVKLFLEYPPSAVYCYGKVICCKKAEKIWIITVKYNLLKECDQDLLIKAALYQQKKILRQRSRSMNRE